MQVTRQGSVQLLLFEQGWHSGARVVQWWEHSPPNNVARIQISALRPCVGSVCRLFSPLLREVFPSPQKLIFSNWSLTRNQVEEEPLSGCANFQSLFIYFLSYVWLEWRICACAYLQSSKNLTLVGCSPVERDLRRRKSRFAQWASWVNQGQR